MEALLQSYSKIPSIGSNFTESTTYITDREKEIRDFVSSSFSNVRVAVRVRPLSQEELEHNLQSVVEISSEDEIIVYHPESREGLLYKFDNCFDETSTAEIIYETTTAKNMSEILLHGHNCSIVVYGPAKTQKSHLFFGNDKDIGFIYLATEELFANLKQLPANFRYHTSVSIWEMDSDCIVDLLHSDLQECKENLLSKIEDVPKIQVHHHPEKGVYMTNITEREVASYENLETVIGSTLELSERLTQERGIRFHYFIKLNLVLQDVEHPEKILRPNLLLVNLKGAEKFGKNGLEKQILKFGATINRSMASLGNAIHNSVSYMTKRLKNANKENANLKEIREKLTTEVHNFFGDCKLCVLLSEALGGQYSTLLFACIPPIGYYYTDIVDTLENLRIASHVVASPKPCIVETEFRTNFLKTLQYLTKMPVDTLAKGHPLTEEQEEFEEMKRKLEALLEGHSEQLYNVFLEEQKKLKNHDLVPLASEHSLLWKKNETLALKHGERRTFYKPIKNGAKETYIGQWFGNKKHGYGEFENEKCKYVGEWNSDKREGNGIYWIKNSATKDKSYKLKRCYKGEWKNNLKHGFGVYYYNDGSIYEGEWIEDKRSGKGVMYYSDGTKYSGLFHNDMEHGFAVKEEKSGDIYKGYFADGLKHGPGTFYYINDRRKYIGEWYKGVAKCGQFEAIDSEAEKASDIPQLEVLNSESILQNSIDQLRKTTV